MSLEDAVSYARWQGALADAFLQQQTGPVVFFVDDDELRKIRTDLDAPTDDLIHAVRGVCDWGAGPLFARVTRMCAEWLRGDRAEPPPVLPVLALTVLAATRMRSDEEGRSTNYYLRLAQALGDGDSSSVERLRTKLSTDEFLDVVDMWRCLHDWIEAQDGVGVSTIRTHERLSRIGYPQSQALLRFSDRADLTRFFHALDVVRIGVPDAQETLRGLEIWTTARQNRLSDTFMSALRDPDTRPLIGTVVQALAGAWDGRVITREGKRRISVRLGIDLDEWVARWLFLAEYGAPGELALAVGAAVVSLSKRPPSIYYRVTGALPVTAEALQRGLRLQGSGYAAEFTPLDVILFRLDAQTGSWSSVPGIAPYEDHVVAAHGSQQDAVRRLLEAAAEPGWRFRPQRNGALLPGYALFEQVRFGDQEALEKALRDRPGLRMLGVAPTLIPRARFVRGLPLARELAPSHYLVGGQPDLLLPTPAEPSLVPMVLDGKEDFVPAYGFPLELRRFELEPGRHEIDADGQSLSFTLIEEVAGVETPNGTASLGWSRKAELGPAGEAHIIGGVVSHARQTHVAVGRRGRDESWLLLEGGETHAVLEPEVPAFAAEVRLDFLPTRFELPVPERARWLAQRKGRRWTLIALHPLSAREVTAEFDVLGTWRRAFQHEKGQIFWELQLGLASA